jgi:hypothetical protein
MEVGGVGELHAAFFTESRTLDIRVRSGRDDSFGDKEMSQKR